MTRFDARTPKAVPADRPLSVEALLRRAICPVVVGMEMFLAAAGLVERAVGGDHFPSGTPPRWVERAVDNLGRHQAWLPALSRAIDARLKSVLGTVELPPHEMKVLQDRIIDRTLLYLTRGESRTAALDHAMIDERHALRHRRIQGEVRRDEQLVILREQIGGRISAILERHHIGLVPPLVRRLVHTATRWAKRGLANGATLDRAVDSAVDRVLRPFLPRALAAKPTGYSSEEARIRPPRGGSAWAGNRSSNRKPGGSYFG